MPPHARALAPHTRGVLPAGGPGSLPAVLTRRHAYALLAVAAAVPRLAVLLHERATITSAFVDKGDTFARTFLGHGTYGFIPGHPSAYTQPLYGFFLVPLYWIFGRSWEVVGLAQLAVAIATAWLVYEVGRRVVSRGAAFLAALAATLHPYLVWHDMHMNREVLDQLLAAAIVLCTLVAVERRSLLWGALLGLVLGTAILGNVRLLLVGVVLAAWIAWQAGRWVLPAAAIALACGALVVLPWTIRNQVQLGCFSVTTDGRALWKANNPQTLDLLRHGRWIDNVRSIPGYPMTPQDAGALYEATGRVVETDECAQMRFYRHRAQRFILHHAGEKAKLAAWGARMEWQPSVTKTTDRPGQGTALDTLRSSAEPVFMVALYVLGLVGLWFVPRAFAVLTLGLLAYNTAFAMLFVGETRYRAPWDFLIAICAASAVAQLWPRLHGRLRPAPA